MRITETTFGSFAARICPQKIARRLRAACAAKLLPLLLLTLPAMVQAQDYTYTTNGGSITITGYAGPGGAVTVPDTIGGLWVTLIYDKAFQDCTNLTRITIPYRVESIGSWAFSGCTSLTNVTTLFGYFRFIGSEAFSGCTSLTRITIPDSVISIGDGAFDSCANLTSVTIGSRVAGIGSYAFYSCTSLTNVTIPTSLTSIGDGAFSFCSNLTSVNIPTGVTSIGVATFSFCANLSAIIVNATNSSYASVDGVLFDKSQTTLIQYPGSKAGSYAVPSSVTGIADQAFGGCRNLTSVTIPNSVTSIGSSTFTSCYSLASVTIPDSITSIGDGMFESCTSLTSVTIPNSIASIGDQAFEHCENLTGVFFKGNAPGLGGVSVFDFDNQATVYYLAGTMGWSPTFGDRPTALWIEQAPESLVSVGVRTNRFGFTINGTSNLVIVVEACTNLANPFWVPLHTNSLTGGSSYFSDSQWTDYPKRFYRVRSP
jgi:hypothetical protein